MATVITLGLLAALGGRAQGQTVYVSTLDRATSENSASFGAGVFQDEDTDEFVTLWSGFRFTTGPATTALSGIKVRLREDSFGALNPVLYQVDDGQLPQSPPLTAFSYGSIPGSYADIDFTPSANITLAPNTTYAFVLRPTSGFYGWQEIYIGGGDPGFYSKPGSDWSLPIGFVISTDLGEDWQESENVYRPVAEVSVVSAVPEPSFAALLSGLIGLVAVCGWRRKK